MLVSESLGGLVVPSTEVAIMPQEMEDFGELDDVLQGGPVPQLNANQ